MKILVTGGLGFIGHQVVKSLAPMHSVAVIDNVSDYGVLDSRELQHLVELRRAEIGTDIEWYSTGIEHRSTVDYVIGKVDPEIIIHLASFPRQKTVQARPDLAARTMTEGLVNVLESARTQQVRRLVFVSSSMVYGDFQDHCDETSPCQPMGQYGILKLAGEHLVRDVSRRSHIEHVILRPSAVYGARDVGDRVIAKFFQQAWKNGTLVVSGRDEALDFTDVRDVAQGIVQAALSANTGNQTYNITRGESVKLLRAAGLIRDLVGRGVIKVQPRNEEYPSRGSLNIDAARRDFGYDPQISIEQGLENYYHWFIDTFHRSTKAV